MNSVILDNKTLFDYAGITVGQGKNPLLDIEFPSHVNSAIHSGRSMSFDCTGERATIQLMDTDTQTGPNSIELVDIHGDLKSFTVKTAGKGDDILAARMALGVGQPASSYMLLAGASYGDGESKQIGSGSGIGTLTGIFSGDEFLATTEHQIQVAKNLLLMVLDGEYGFPGRVIQSMQDFIDHTTQILKTEGIITDAAL